MKRFCICLLIATLLYLSGLRPSLAGDAGELRLFDGRPKTFVVNGYSTSFRWPDVLQRKLDRYTGKPGQLKVVKATKAGTPIAKWLDLKRGNPSDAWEKVVRPAFQSHGDSPTVALAQQSLQWVFGSRTEGIRSRADTERIKKAADVMQDYAGLLKQEGADLVFLSTHIYKKPMEPEIGNERYALNELMRRNIDAVHRGPDVWSPTRPMHPEVFAEDGVHPSQAGAKILAQLWFERLLEYAGRDVPEWSRKEMIEALQDAAPRREKWEWAPHGVLWGQRLPDFTCYSPKGKKRDLAELWADKPAVLVTGSLTDPVARRAVSEVQDIAYKFGDQVNVAIVYVIEAHPVYDISPYLDCACIQPANKRDNIFYRQPKKLKDRLKLARKLRERTFASVPIMVDTMQNRIWKALGGGQNTAALVRPDGTIFAKQSWFRAYKMKEDIEELLERRQGK